MLDHDLFYTVSNIAHFASSTPVANLITSQHPAGGGRRPRHERVDNAPDALIDHSVATAAD
jgi:hypothetical protein